MDLCNPTGDTISTMFDSVAYIFTPRSVLTIPDEAGRHISNVYSMFGITEVHFGDDPAKIRYSGLMARTRYYEGVLNAHDLVNKRQSEMKFPPIPDSDAVQQARVALPIYQKALGKIEKRLGSEKAAAYAADLETLLGERDMKLPLLKDATLEAMRAEATRVGVQWSPGWNYAELREAIESFKAVSTLPDAPLQSPQVSESAPGPNPLIHIDDLTEGVFSKL